MLMRRRGVHSGLVVKVFRLLEVFETELFLYFICLSAGGGLIAVILVNMIFQNRSIYH